MAKRVKIYQCPYCRNHFYGTSKLRQHWRFCGMGRPGG